MIASTLEIPVYPVIRWIKKHGLGRVALSTLGQQLCNIPEIEMVEQACELSNINICDRLIAPNQEHVFVI